MAILLLFFYGLAIYNLNNRSDGFAASAVASHNIDATRKLP